MSHDPCQVVYDALVAHDCHPRGPEYNFRAHCPAHDSDSPSLSVSEGVDRRAVLHCFVGCDTPDIIRALGLGWSDLFPDGHRHAPSARRWKLEAEPLLVSVERALGAAGIHWHYTGSPDLIVAEHCPACRKPRPLLIHDDGKRLRVGCWSQGCETETILDSLTRLAVADDEATATAIAQLTGGAS